MFVLISFDAGRSAVKLPETMRLKRKTQTKITKNHWTLQNALTSRVRLKQYSKPQTNITKTNKTH